MSKYMLTFCPQHFHNNKWGNSEHSLSPEFPIWGRVSEKICCGNFVEIKFDIIASFTINLATVCCICNIVQLQ